MVFSSTTNQLSCSLEIAAKVQFVQATHRVLHLQEDDVIQVSVQGQFVAKCKRLRFREALEIS